MSIQAVAWALEQDLPQGPKLVLVSLANHANHEDGYCWLKAETIGREASCSPRSVFRYVGGLVRNGYVRKAPRKGQNGKQRANDYWLLLDREDKVWDWGAQLEEDGVDLAQEEESVEADDQPQDVVEPHANLAHGETPEPDDTAGAREAVETPPVSHGPCATAVTRNESLNHPNINRKLERAGARVRGATPRAYRPPPPQPVAADTEAKVNPIFVFEGSRAWDAWVAVEKKRRGVTWTLTTRKEIDGKWRTGWYWPTLFPPAAQPPPSTDSDGKTDTAA